MRRFLDLYGAAGLLAGLCTVGVLVSVLAAIIARQLSLNIPGTDAYAGYFMAAAGFLALASTFKHGEHIRVTLLLNSLSPAGSRRLDIFALAVLPAGRRVRLLQRQADLRLLAIQRRLHVQRRHAALDSPDQHGRGHGPVPGRPAR